MKALAFNGSPRHNGNTFSMLSMVLSELKDQGFDTELVQLGGRLIRGCTACRACSEMKNGRCIIDDDIVNECIVKMSAADAIILGSPTYFGDINPEIKALIDRAGLVSRANGDLFSRKVGAAVIAVRRTGGLHAFDSINHFFLINDMMVPGSSYWNMSLSGDIGDFDNDVEGKATMKRLAENISWLVEKIKT